ncbi:hypothetical protein BD626DRAFT_71423 [Schizophyllum amplum]|uniref:Uncharacterized protein n=1 Tax=Schizophyllum amplum TaxID=97359 RepID=A0A550CA80_9AGAR|nr:hypothetical protein BD626DRAFT_71423 [Auriculariopsis ampla]
MTSCGFCQSRIPCPYPRRVANCVSSCARPYSLRAGGRTPTGSLRRPFGASSDTCTSTRTHDATSGTTLSAKTSAPSNPSTSAPNTHPATWTTSSNPPLISTPSTCPNYAISTTRPAVMRCSTVPARHQLPAYTTVIVPIARSRACMSSLHPR